jgi:potassium efflux system protein
MKKVARLFLAIFLVCLIFACFESSVANARPYSTSLKNIAQQILLLSDQQELLKKQVHLLKIEKAEFDTNSAISYQEVIQLRRQIQIRVEMTNLQENQLSQSLKNVQQRGNKLTEMQKQLQVRLLSEQASPEKMSLASRLQSTEELIRLNQKEIELLVVNLDLAKEINAVYHAYLSACSMHLESIEKQQVIQSLHQMIVVEQHSMDEWLMKMNVLNQEKSAPKKELDKQKLLSMEIIEESQLFYYTQQVQLSNLKVMLLEVSIQEKRLIDNFKNLQQETNMSAKLDSFKGTLNDESSTLEEVSGALKQHQQLVKKQGVLIQHAFEQHWISSEKAIMLKKNLTQLQRRMVELRINLDNQQKDMLEIQSALQNYLTQIVAKRQALLKENAALASGFVYQLAALPKLIMLYFGTLWEQTWQGIVALNATTHLVICGLLMILTGVVWWVGRKYFHFLSEKFSQNRQRTAANMVYILSELFCRNWGTLCIFLYVWFILSFAGISFDAYIGLFYTVLIWFCFRVIMGVARIILVERESDTQGHDVRLYHRLKWVFIVGGWATVLVVLSEQFDIGGAVFEVSNRLFMAFLLTVSIVLIRARHIIPALVDPIFAHRKYLSRTVRTVCWVLPFCFFISTALGLLGYINLSWILIYYQAALILVVASYMILRGLLADVLDISSEWMIRRLSQGWLWSEAFLKPIDRLLRVFLFLCLIISICLLLGWHQNSVVVITMEKFFYYAFFSFSGVDITPLNIIEFIILISFIFWLAKWTREFAYRWLFRNSKDIGIRNSLAVLSQYLVVTFGAIVTLRILGIDMTGISVILGGLAVGLGFGLRDFANNIVGGVMLLIERSVKEGDIVSIGNYEGEVTHIGIRAMQLRSWDHMEVMVPNSEIFMRPFMNWTHHDSIVRTVIPMKILPVDDPLAVQQMILGILHEIPEVLSDPEPEVFFIDADALIEFHVRYFINIAEYKRAAVRSKVILTIVEALKKEGIRPPNPQQDSYLWEVPKNSVKELEVPNE